MKTEKLAIDALDRWYESLQTYQDKLPSKGSIGAALVVLERLKGEFTLDISKHVADGQAQIMGLSGGALKRILEQFGETRTLSAIGGRSNRGARGDVAVLLEQLRTTGLGNLEARERSRVINKLQSHIVQKFVPKYFSVKRVKAYFDLQSATRQFIWRLLDEARACGKAGAVAEYLVGAKLALRFPNVEVRNKRFSTSDTQGGFIGDFEINDTVIHVTMAPMPELFEKCRDNLRVGKRVYLLVPESLLAGTRQNADLLAAGRIAVESIETYVATNIDELSDYQSHVSGFRRLLEKYNERVDSVELDKSLLIEIPQNLG